jgi:hypothetical protein
MDKRSDLMDDWAEGRIGPDASALAVMEATVYKDIATIDHEDIEFFYSK